MKKNKQQQYWENHWGSLKNTILERDIFYVGDLIKMKYILPRIPKKANILEVGGGSSRISCFLAKKGYKTTIIDYSKSAIQVAKNNYKILKTNGTFVLGDARCLPFDDGSFDVVISTGLIEHFEDPSIVVNEMVRVLKKKGLFFSDVIPKKFSLLRSLDFLHKIYFRIRRIKSIEMYERKISKKEMKKMMKRAGLTDIEIYGAYVFPPRVLLPSNLPIFRKNEKIRENEVKFFIKKIPKIMRLDNTVFGDVAGLGYNCFGIKK